MSWNCILERVPKTQSTNDDLLVRWRAGQLIDPVARIAHEQTAGKGRAGRVWLAQPNDTLCFSLAYPFPCRPNELSGLSLVVGLALITGISTALNIPENVLYSQGLRLKWPNDLLLNNAKLGGILIEGGQTTLSDPSWMIIGVGLNLRCADHIAQRLGSQSSFELGALDQLIPAKNALPDMEFIWLQLLASFEKYLTEFKQFGFSHFQKTWAQWDAFDGQAVRISGGGAEPLLGISTGVDPSGALLLNQNNTIIPIHAGDVSLRVQS
ncbi:biotin--[acetyl-CoA-carboxylase] ligase [Polynucleobacter antarcticus]|uniref:biotin--[biotin carboxyl-carrier protein] ligase n=1 Tax=Polynucleobacter antarcticus TaxID=1743162 RepID=A0A6M9PKR9_9BURK|nr:biotin--[acetyl-CoA-carboxylase] ligase [Polynucleobacter antarcticus]QKM63440.1 biotin--[acetyl-CoA-carboxylase] ligase [Polynucleobacter antarcticus]